MLRFVFLAGGASIAFLAAGTASAQDAPAPDSATEPATAAEQAEPAAPPGDFHQEEGGDIVVTGFRRRAEDVLSGTSVVSGVELARDLRPTIGETLSHQAGV